jgi:hypothetical protein
MWWALCSQEDIAIRMSGLIPVINEPGVGPYLAVVALDELEKTQHRSFVYGAEDKGRGRFQ